MNMKWPAPYFFIHFWFEMHIFDIRMTTPLQPFKVHLCENVFAILYCELMCILILRCVSCVQQRDGSSFSIYCSMCLYIGELNPLILRNINYQKLLIIVLLLLMLQLLLLEVVCVYVCTCVHTRTHVCICMLPFF